MILPYSTDAPIYHFPWATLGMVAANAAIHVAWCSQGPEWAEPYAMKLGDGLHPLQWLSHNFLHADIFHIAINMVFLWSYGIIVEGKVGPILFLLIYLGIGTAHGAAIQAAYLHAAEPTYVLGASGIIFGLMAIAMVWAPKNEIQCLFIMMIGFRVVSHDFSLPIYVLALIQLGLEAGSMALTYLIRHDPMSSALLHLSGALWGLVFGIVVVKLGWVDCEGWDVFSLMAKRKALRKAWEARGAQLDRVRVNHSLPRKSQREPEDRPGLPPEERTARLLAKVHAAVEAGDPAGVEASFARWQSAFGPRPPRDALLAIIKAMHARQLFQASIPPMRALCRAHPDGSDKVRLRLASILLREANRPTEARRHLLQLAPDRLDDSLRRLHRSLVEEADRMIEDGVLELEEDA